ncbi:hypothetical protein M409DRAFT_53814 [Zasmidium cellare ATCC 36951]|uniref:RRM domain-containing protein n=1 Tax=Zasmidium cellare ATCC 36951 TaxID=1080233 RepID=A0A6A6CNP2_ZASCE|nr:uncharacterized protein M409DRAFT_53814 [Zasmidium cellare ATCC 36951]KAF2167858.1 hypothetical protein M409DRAFT_53814 [Zasmidium cellare ATCC 36951]
MAATERTRLHITPFNPDLLDRYISLSLKPQATNISFHTVETFPERGFGYVELPTMEAQKLKKKLNGSTLKGAKVKIEEAKPEKKKRKSSDAVEEDVDDKKARKKAKKEKRKKEQGVIPGHELEEGRRVKRGWDEKNPLRTSSKKEDGGLESKKMRFKTVVPPNKVESVEKEKSKVKKDKKERKGKKEVVVKEFAKTTKPLSTATVASRKGARYEEGVGWVDEDGNVVEEEQPQKKRRRSKAAKEAPEPEPEAEPEPESEPEPEHELESDSEAEPEAARKQQTIAEEETGPASEDSGAESDGGQAEQPEEQNDSSDSDTSDAAMSEDDDDQVDRQLKQAQTNLACNAAVEREQSNSIPIADAFPSAEVEAASAVDKEIHPLEALFKRPAPNAEEAVKAKRPTPIDTSFSFFNRGADDDEVVIENNPPQTPHTKQDLEWRSIRSAAPTPDTAAIGKRFSFPFAAEDVDNVDDVDQDEDIDMQDADEEEAVTGAEKGKDGEREESEFRKWFYDNRGDLNRSWKKRRREEKKIARQRENRRLSRRLA